MSKNPTERSVHVFLVLENGCCAMFWAGYFANKRTFSSSGATGEWSVLRKDCWKRYAMFWCSISLMPNGSLAICGFITGTFQC